MENGQRVRTPATSPTSEVEDVYSDLYSTLSQVTSSTVNDIDQLPYQLTFKSAVTYLGACLCGLLFGYDTGVISGVLLKISPEDISREVITNFDKELITSVTCLGSFFGSILGFPLSDTYGRRKTLAFCSAIFIVGGIWMALSKSLSLLIMGRLVVGVAIGIAAQCVPVFLSEVSPASIRGTVLTLNSLAITGGQFLSYVAAYMLADLKHSWRYLFGISAIPAVIFLALMKFIPESPRWLISRSEFTKAHASLRVIYPAASSQQLGLKLRKLVQDICKLRKYEDIEEPLLLNRSKLFGPKSKATTSKQSMDGNQNGTVTTEIPDSLPQDRHQKQVHKMEPRAKRALVIGCVLMFFQQASGFNAFMYYATILFEDLNVSNPLLPAMGIAFTNFLFTFVALGLVDIVGKRAMLLYTIWIMTLSLLLSTVSFDINDTRLILTSVLMFVASFASAMGNIPWSSVEFLPLNRRAFGASCISCTNWLTNTVVSMSFLSLVNHFGSKNIMLAFALFTALNWVFVYFWYPEVKGLTLEEIGKVFDHGIDVNYVYRNYH